MGMGAHTLSFEEVCKELGSDSKMGLSFKEALARQSRFGKNELPKPKRFSAWIIFFRQFSSPLIWFLLFGALIAGFLGEWIQMSAISAIVVLNAFVSFFQEFSAEKSFESLKSLYVVRTRVIRDGKMEEIASQDIVPGDLIMLESGDQVPADGRLIQVSQLGVQEASLTGESNTVSKEINPLNETLSIADQKNMVFSGTHVVRGRATYIVTKIGTQTEIGKIAVSLRSQTKEITPLQIRFNRLGKQLVLICVGVILLIGILGFAKGMGIVQISMIALSLAVAAIPEGLPAIVTITLAMGVRKMVKNNTLIRRLASVETLGCTSVICSDKTGTITKNEMEVLHFWIDGKLYSIKEMVDAEAKLLLALKIGVLCNNAEINKEDKTWKASGDPTESALLVAAVKANLFKEKLESEAPFIAEIPFDSERKRMSVLRGDGNLYVKGALEALLPLCTVENQNVLLKAQSELASKGFRVLALAIKKQAKTETIDPSIESELEFVGLVAMMDPPKEGVKEAVAQCKQAGITPVMITGDHQETAVAIGKEIGLMDQHSLVINGSDLDDMGDELLKQTVLKTSIFARVNPEHKLRIIKAWKAHGEVVAMTGDGVNDAPAIKMADIGISMGNTGTEVTKQASDMVLLDDHFATIVQAVKEGRSIYNNILCFVKFLLSANFAEILVICFGLFWGFGTSLGQVFVMLLPVQILWVNLVTDGFPSIALAFDPSVKGVMKQKPRLKNEPILSSSWIIMLILIGFIEATCSLFSGYIGFGVSKELGQTMVFTALVLIELVVLFVIRSPLSLFSNPILIFAVTLSVLMQLLVLYLPIMQIPLGTLSLGLENWSWILGVSLVAILASRILFFLFRRGEKI